ncbi:MAG TPA: hypothetical protein VFV64_04875 [Permianibacter sp.]|nr:hypothetical protein [Permianibacter sp.]
MRAAVVFGIAFLSIGCSPCEDRLLSRVLSPDETKEAVSFIRDCGATTAPAFHIALTVPGHQPSAENTVAIFDHTESIGLRWEDSEKLHITADPNARKFRELGTYDDVAIFYH